VRTAGAQPLALAVAPSGVAVRVALVVLASALLALCARVEVPLPFSPVPVTGQTLAVLLVGASLGARLGALSVALYVIEGLAGLPVFAGGASGVARLTGATGGYLVGFVVAAAIVGWAAERGWTRSVPRTVIAMLLGEMAIYAFGLAWLARFPLTVTPVQAGLIPFIAGDLYKIALATVLLPPLTRRVSILRAADGQPPSAAKATGEGGNA
jgi:biotin transport system substrate-specific component